MLAATSAAALSRPFRFDPAVTLVWSVPGLLVVPLTAAVVILGGVRGRRSASNLALFAVVLTLLDALLVGWARLRTGAAYSASFQYMNLPVSFQGDQRFQTFEIDISFRVDHAALAAVVVLLVVFLAALTWHRILGRGDEGPIRAQVNAMLLLLCALGVVVSGDMAEQLAFWTVAGIATFFLLSHRWGTEASGRASRFALALPFVGDVALLCAVGLLYSRFGQLTLTGVAPVLHTTLGVGLTSLTAAAVLIVAAVAVRAGLWPFTAWQTGTVGQPGALIALVAGVWPILAGVVLYRYLPVLGAAGVQGPRTASYAFAVAAVLGPSLALIAGDVRRAVLLASSGAVALALLGVLFPASAAVGLTALLAIAAGRTAILLAVGSVAFSLRTKLLRFWGGGWQVIPATMLGLGASAAAMALGATAAAALRPRSAAWIGWAAGLFLVALAMARVYGLAAHGELPRRRAFDPDRVREAPPAPLVVAFTLGVAAVAIGALGFFTSWVDFLGTPRHPVDVRTDVLWLLPAVAGGLVGIGAFVAARQTVGRAVDAVAARFESGRSMARTAFSRIVARPGLAIARAVEVVALPAAETGLGRSLETAGALVGRAAPWTAAAVLLGVVLAVAFAVLSPGVAR